MGLALVDDIRSLSTNDTSTKYDDGSDLQRRRDTSR